MAYRDSGGYLSVRYVPAIGRRRGRPGRLGWIGRTGRNWGTSEQHSPTQFHVSRARDDGGLCQSTTCDDGKKKFFFFFVGIILTVKIFFFQPYNRRWRVCRRVDVKRGSITHRETWRATRANLMRTNWRVHGLSRQINWMRENSSTVSFAIKFFFFFIFIYANVFKNCDCIWISYQIPTETF